MSSIHPNDLVYALERALQHTIAAGEDRKVIEDLRQVLADARREARA